MAKTDQEILWNCPLFYGLADEDLAALAMVAYRRQLDPGEVLFLAGEEAQGMHIVVNGRVKVFVISPASGREMILTVEQPYQTVAELVALDGGGYPASAEALEASEVLILEQEGFQRVLRERPDIGVHLMRMLGRRLRRLVNLIEAISFQEVVHRLASYLLEHAADGVPFALDTNAAIAAELGTVPELVSRNLSRLAASGAITMQQREVLNIDENELAEMAHSAGR